MVKTTNISCPRCSLPVKNNEQALQCEGQCESWFHIKCENISERTYQRLVDDEESTWMCSGCSRRSPTNPTSGPSEESPQGAQAKNGKKAAAKKTGTVTIDDLNPSVQLLGTKLNQLVESVDFFSDKFDDVLEKIQRITVEQQRIVKMVDGVKRGYLAVQKENAELKNRVNALEQAMIAGELEINGIPPSTNENCENIFRAICDKTECPVDASDVVQVRRIPAPKSAKKASQTIVVTLKSPAIRQKVLDARKARLVITLSDIGFGSTEPAGVGGRRFFMNERLTPYNRHLFWMAREAKKNLGYKYCWVKNGTIYLRKTDADSAIRVSSEEDLPTASARQPAKAKGVRAPELDDSIDDDEFHEAVDAET